MWRGINPRATLSGSGLLGKVVFQHYQLPTTHYLLEWRGARPRPTNGASFNGRTMAFGAIYVGSNPTAPANSNPNKECKSMNDADAVFLGLVVFIALFCGTVLHCLEVAPRG